MSKPLERSPRDRLARLVRAHFSSAPLAGLTDLDPLLLNPASAAEVLRAMEFDAFVAGPLERRVVGIRGDSASKFLIADLSGKALEGYEWPEWWLQGVTVDDASSWLSSAAVEPAALYRLQRPRVLLAALYHPEIFPLPRFPLGISNVARAARNTLSGEVWLLDMQLGVTVADIMRDIETREPDIVGVSATFGQYDLLCAVLDGIAELENGPLVVAGGSLTARNERLLLDRYPRLLVARGAGESTITDLVAYFHHDKRLHEVSSIGFSAQLQLAPTYSGRGHTARPNSREHTDMRPELDLLDPTLSASGVAQLETSRGCTNYCSFCPRGHKGIWAPGNETELDDALAAIRTVFDQHADVSRTLYLVDEEFIGRDEGAVERALDIASRLRRAGFRWESSCRIDQVVTPGEPTEWQIERADMWRELVSRGLRRMLFGVESGVDSILDRFNKQTSAEQNVLAIRTLSALGVPTRFTYITFDQLMSLEELRASHAFQARTDLILKRLPDLSPAEIVAGVRDLDFVAEHAVGTPFYTAISYMLVSMECLIGAPYTRAASAAGLTGEARPSMGRLDATFADWRIGLASECAQLWVDRNFALDYTLKSLEKVIDGPVRVGLHRLRVRLRDEAFLLLTTMIETIGRYRQSDFTPRSLEHELRHSMDARWVRLQALLTPELTAMASDLRKEHRAFLEAEVVRWGASSGWALINAADPCGT